MVMTPTGGVVLCVAYILGLLSTSVVWGRYAVLVLGVAIASLVFFGKGTSYRNKLPNSFWQVKPQLWVVASLIGFLATIYFQIRTPQPGMNDVSKFVVSSDVNAPAKVVTVKGYVVSTPRLNRNQKGQFWLDATDLITDNSANVTKVTGKLYVTLPLLQATGLHEGEAIALTGNLYKPQSANNPGGFDFRAYLAQEGSFAGLRGREVSLPETEANFKWGWWAIRQKIIRSQVRWLGVPEGPLVSAMVLGNRVVDVPFYISDSFIKIGLAHALAASGFQVSLILGVVLTLTKRFSKHIQFGLGIAALIIFVGLSGVQPSVIRAVVMGIAVLIALVLQRQVKPLELLLLAATLMLVFNPLWIWNLSFQFSFLATLGLVVTVPALIKRLDWLPSTIATLIAVPIAAYIWTLPLQIYMFGLVSPYSILVNIITTIPISIISLGAFISAIAALILPTVGSAIAWLLYYPTHTLIAIVDFFNYLPGSRIAVGTISTLQLIALYGIITLVCIQKYWRRYWWIAGIVAISLVLVPLQTQATISRITVLANGKQPVLVVQDQGKVLLVYSGDANQARYTVLPFLQQQGVNQIDWGIMTNSLSDHKNGWLEIMQNLTVKTFYQTSQESEYSLVQQIGNSHYSSYQTLNVGQKVATGSTSVEILTPTQMQLQIKGQTWLLLGTKLDLQKQLALSKKLTHAQVLLWSGESLDPSLIKAIQPEIAIATATKLNHDTMSQLRQHKVNVFLTGRDGAIQWTPDGKFKTAIETTENRASAL